MERRMSGKVKLMIYEKSDMLETLKQIELMNISKEEKDLLFVVTQESDKNEKKSLLMTLDLIIKMGMIFPTDSSSRVIKNKIYSINNKKREDIINIAINLKKRIENNEIIF